MMSKEALRAFVFPGQGSQKKGMGQEVYDAYKFVEALYGRANEILKDYGWSEDLRKLCFEDPKKILGLTEFTQPAIYVTSLAYCEVLREQGVYPHAAAGHSLGEYSALTAVESLTFEDGVKLVAERGRLMAEAGRENPGKMAAIIGLELEQVEEEIIKGREGVYIANYNSPGQIVISGEEEAVKLASEVARKAGAKLVKLLDVSIASHCPWMKLAAEKLADFIAREGIAFREPETPFYSPTVAIRVESPAEIQGLLIAQLTGRVQWVSTIRKMIEDRYTHFHEVGPGNVLSGLIRRIDKNLTVKAF